MRLLVVAVAWLAMPGSAGAFQFPEVSAPLTGVVFAESSGSLRAIRGFPGAAYLGEPILRGVDGAQVAPDGDSAVVRSSGRLHLVTGIRGGILRFLELSQLEGGTMVAWSGNSKAVAVYFPGPRQLLSLRFEDGEWRRTLVDAGPGKVSGLAVNGQTGATVLAEAGDSGGGWLVMDAAGPLPSRIGLSGVPSAISFGPQDRELFVVSEPARMLFRLNGAGGGELSAVPLTAIEPFSVAGLAGLENGRVLLLDRSGPRALILDAGGAVETALELEAEPGEAVRLAHGSLFLICTGRTRTEPFLVLSLAGAPRVYFVPQTPE